MINDRRIAHPDDLKEQFRTWQAGGYGSLAEGMRLVAAYDLP
jgi:hypothetical protein